MKKRFMNQLWGTIISELKTIKNIMGLFSIIYLLYFPKTHNFQFLQYSQLSFQT